ncbi:MAG: tetratricopeptide repeat protein [Longimicrobiales bacterium]|nr:tetratricopeptide repeat protein [Longimicrobiales bacterium]
MPKRIPAVLAVSIATVLTCTGCDRADDSLRRLVPDAAPASDPSAATDAVRTNLSATPEATSLGGEPLYPLVLDPEEEARLHLRIDSMEAAHDARPDDRETLIWLGRYYGYAGHFRDAIDVFTEGIREHPDDPRLYRHRGHRHITVRELGRAVEDLEHAARLTSGHEDRVEPDGMPNPYGVPRSTLQTNIWYHLGLARYLQHDFARAAHAFRRGYEISPNDDMRVAMADWLWLALMRLERDREAGALLDEVSADMEILENDAYLQRLLVYKGQLPPDSLLPDGAGADPLTVATHGYGLGAWHLVRGNEARAREVFRRVIGTGYWPAFGYIAAEAELAAMDSRGPPGGSRGLKISDPAPVDSLRR